MTITTGTCECGATVDREMPRGPSGRPLLLPIICEACEAGKVAEWEREDRESAERAAVERQATRLRASGLPRALLTVDLDALDPSGTVEAINAARYWAARGGGLLLTGPIGVGKTTTAAGATRIVLNKRSAKWTSAPLLMARLGSGFGDANRDLALALMTGTCPLVLDDLDKTRPTEYGAEQVFLMVDGAVSNDRALLVTTNLSLGELAAKWPAPYGEAIASRLTGYCKVVELSGEDRRLA